MRAVRRHPVFRFLASMRLTMVLLLSFATAIAVATFIESDLGTPAAKALVYDARWFEGLLGLLVINLALALGRWFPFRLRRLGFALIHVAIIVILIGAGITRWLGYEGIMSIREGASADFMYSRRNYVRLESAAGEAAFTERLYRPGEQRLSRNLRLGSRSYRVDVEEFWPSYREELTEGEGGRPIALVDLFGQGGTTELALPVGSVGRNGAHAISYLGLAPFADELACADGVLRVRIGGESVRMPVPAGLPASITLAGYRLTILEFWSDFLVGGAASGSRKMANPVIRVQIESPAGKRVERDLFAFFPDFMRSQGGATDGLSGVNLAYELERRVELTGSSGRMSARSTVALIGEALPPPGRLIAPGTVFDPERVGVLSTADGEPLFALRHVFTSAISRPASGDDPDAWDAVRVVIEAESGERVSVLLVAGTVGLETIELGEDTLRVGYGPLELPLPHRLKLDDFVMKTYPGSSKPSGFESRLRLFDEAAGIDGRPVLISMNHPFMHNGFKHFQWSHDDDRRGSILIVSFDPGKWPTYLGYLMITVGLVVAIVQAGSARDRRDALAGSTGAAE